MRENPAAQYVLVKTVVGQVMGVVDARARPVEPEGYNLLKYCWTAENVLGDWAERTGLPGAMIVRALETRSWQRDLARAGYPEAPTAEAIGRYEAMLVSAGFTDAARARAVDALVVDLDELRRKTPGAAQVRAIHRCDGQQRSLALNYKTAPEDGRARFMPYVLHQICQAQQLNPGRSDPLRLLDVRQDRQADVVRRRDRLQRALARRVDGKRAVRSRAIAQRRYRDAAPASRQGDEVSYFGASTMIICRPSMRGIYSILVSGSISARTRLSTCRPSSDGPSRGRGSAG